MQPKNPPRLGKYGQGTYTTSKRTQQGTGVVYQPSQSTGLCISWCTLSDSIHLNNTTTICDNEWIPIRLSTVEERTHQKEHK